MTVLATLKENIICPDGEEYRAIWGVSEGYEDVKASAEAWVTIGKISIPASMLTALIECEKPAKDKGIKTKEGFVASGSTETIKHIYYSE